MHNIDDSFGFCTVRVDAGRCRAWARLFIACSLGAFLLQAALLGYLGFAQCLLCQELSTIKAQGLVFNGNTMGHNQQTVFGQ